MENQKLEQCLYLDKFTSIVDIEAAIIKREISTAGYYCYFGFKKDMEKSKNNGFVGNVNLILSNENIGGAMIFLENGLLKMIECYFWQQNTFFEDINKFGY